MKGDSFWGFSKDDDIPSPFHSRVELANAIVALSSHDNSFVSLKVVGDKDGL